jgi:hypothetical protein
MLIAFSRLASKPSDVVMVSVRGPGLAVGSTSTFNKAGWPGAPGTKLFTIMPAPKSAFV